MYRRNSVSTIILALALVSAVHAGPDKGPVGPTAPFNSKKVFRPVFPATMPKGKMNEIFAGRLLIKLRGANKQNGTPAVATSSQQSNIQARLGNAKLLGGLNHGGWTVWQIPDDVDPRVAAEAVKGQPDVIYAEPLNKVYALGLPVPNDGSWSAMETQSPYVFNFGGSSGSGLGSGSGSGSGSGAGSGSGSVGIAGTTPNGFRKMWNIWDTSAVTSDAGGVLSGGWALYPGTWYTAKTKPTNCPIIAFIDSGVDMSHPDFINAGGSSTDSAKGGQILASLSASFEQGAIVPNTPPVDLNGHGTHVTGLAIAAGNNGTFDGDGVIGIGYNSQGMILRVIEADGTGDDATAAEAIYYAADHHAAVINLSLGDRNYSQVFQDAVTYAFQAGSLVVAAGNEQGTEASVGTNDANEGPIYPAACSGALGVTANGPNEVSADDNFSGYGSYIGMAAPGGDIVQYGLASYTFQFIWSTASTVPVYLQTNPVAGQLPYTLDYTFLTGTSMACPHVSGAAGLWYGLSGLNQQSGFSNIQCLQALESTADGSGGALYGGWEQTQGYGSLNVQSLMSYKTNPNPRLATVGDVTGIVYYGGTPVPNARITATLVAAPHTVYQTTSLSDGTYRFDPFPAGQYDVTASPFGSPKTKRVQVTNGCDLPGNDFFCGPAITDTTPPKIAIFKLNSATATNLTVDQWAYDTESEIDSSTAQVGTKVGVSDIYPLQHMRPGLNGFSILGVNFPTNYFVTFTYTNGVGLQSLAIRALQPDVSDACVTDSSKTTDQLQQKLTVKSGAAGSNEVAYISIDLTKVRPNVGSAILALNGAANGAPVTVGLYGTNNASWTEAGLNWNDAPAIQGSTLGDIVVSSGHESGKVQWDITSLMQAAKKAGLATMTVALKCDSNSSTGASFYSQRSSVNAPLVTVMSHD